MNRPTHAQLLTMIHAEQLSAQQIDAELQADPAFAAYWAASIGVEQDPAPTPLGWAIAFGFAAACWVAFSLWMFG